MFKLDKILIFILLLNLAFKNIISLYIWLDNSKLGAKIMDLKPYLTLISFTIVLVFGILGSNFIYLTNLKKDILTF